jgi:hypothetical protein
MRQLTIAATFAVAALIVAAPASAERIGGGPVKQNGQCWKGQKYQDVGTWGSWEACAAPAKTVTVTKRRHA